MVNKPLNGAIAKVGASIIEKLVNKGIDSIKDQAAQIKLWREYEGKYLERYGKVKLTLTGMREPVLLENIYKGVRFLDDLSIGRFASLESLEEEFRQNPRHFQRQGNMPLDGISVANENPLLMVLGGPGVGKSTYLRRIGLEVIKGNRHTFEHDCIPVMLELKQFDGEIIDIKAAIVSEFSHVGVDFSDAFVEEALKQGKLLILLDGLDEVPRTNQKKMIQAIQNFVNRYHGEDQPNRFIASCRIAAFKSSLPGFKDIELADFDDEQILQFIRNWFRSPLSQENKIAEKCWKLLKSKDYASTRELAQTPLLLTFLCVVFERTQLFPANRASLYRKAIDIFLEEWSAEKMVYYEPIYQGLNTELEKVLLADLAYHGFVEDRLFFTRDELILNIQKFLEDSAEKPKYLDGKAVLDAIAIQQGILIERAECVYSFSHLTVQEYLTAQYLSQDSSKLKTILKEYLVVSDWREVFLLTAGLSLPSSDKLLKQMLLIAENYEVTNKLENLLEWTYSITLNSKHKAPDFIKRSIVIFLALALTPERNPKSDLASNHALTLAQRHSLRADSINFAQAIARVRSIARDLNLSRARSLAHGNARERAITLAPALVRELDKAVSAADRLEKTQIFNYLIDLSTLNQPLKDFKSLIQNMENIASPSNKIRSMAKKLDEAWYAAFQLDPKLLELTDAELQTLADQLYIYELILRCKESSILVSLTTWEDIEKKLLMPTRRKRD